MIEKAYKKLRLDALVIQQGRLTENVKGVGKDDLLAMVRYGAEMVFSGGTVRWVPSPFLCRGVKPRLTAGNDCCSVRCIMLLAHRRSTAVSRGARLAACSRHLSCVLQSGLVTDADIDAIIAKGEQETAELNNKLQEYTEHAMKFTMDGGASSTGQ